MTDETSPSTEPPDFDDAFQGELLDLFAWRRDVRRFRTDPLPEGAVRGLIDIAGLAPSVGNSQPWRFVTVREAERRAEIVRIFEKSNHEALNDYHGDKAKLYASLKLSGLVKAPEHLAVYADVETNLGSGLGQRTMPETLASPSSIRQYGRSPNRSGPSSTSTPSSATPISSIAWSSPNA